MLNRHEKRYLNNYHYSIINYKYSIHFPCRGRPILATPRVRKLVVALITECEHAPEASTYIVLGQELVLEQELREVTERLTRIGTEECMKQLEQLVIEHDQKRGKKYYHAFQMLS